MNSISANKQPDFGTRNSDVQSFRNASRELTQYLTMSPSEIGDVVEIGDWPESLNNEAWLARFVCPNQWNRFLHGVLTNG